MVPVTNYKTMTAVVGVKKTTGDEASSSQSNSKHRCLNPKAMRLVTVKIVLS